MASKSKAYKPTSAGRREMTPADFSMLTGKKREPKLTRPLKRKAGRNNQGRITVRHRGGGAKKAFRIVDLKLTGEGSLTVKEIKYDPNRSARIALVEDEKKEQRYILAGDKLQVGQVLLRGQKTAIADHNTLALKEIPSGLTVYAVEMRPGEGAKLARSAGSYATVQGLDKGNVQLKLSSGRVIWLNGECRATLGQVGNGQHSAINVGKAGRKRHLGRRPTVRGKAMHPAAHPHGGGEGGSPIGLKGGPKTKWGHKALGVKTRRRKFNLVKI